MKERTIKVIDYILDYCLYGLILFLPISTAGVEIFASLLIFFFFIKKLLKPDFYFFKNRTHLYLLFFVIFNVLSLFNSGIYLKKSLNALFFKWLEYILIFLIVQDTLNSQKKIRNVLVIFLAVAGLVAIDGIFQKFFGFDFLRQKGVIPIKEGMSGITGPFNHYNNFAGYLVCVLLIALSLLFLRSKKIIYQLGLSLLIILLGLCLLFTFSRGGWLSFLLGVILMLFLSRRLKIIFPIIFIFLIILILIPTLRERAIFTFQKGGDATRFNIWEAAFRMIKENPFLGKGIGTFMDYFPKYTQNLGVQYAHNCFLQIWAETGIFSLLSFLLFAGSILLRGIRYLGTVPVRGFPFLIGLISSFFAFLVGSFFDTHLYSLQLSVLFWFIGGWLLALTKPETVPRGTFLVQN